MEIEPVRLSPDEYTQTGTGNKIYKLAFLFGSQNIVINGKTILMKECMLRGDLSAIRMGKYNYIGERTIIRAGNRRLMKGVTLYPVHVGDYVVIEDDCVVMAAQIGSYSFVGKGSIVGRNVVIKECCRVEPASVISDNSTFPPFCVIAGNPARVVGQVPECTQELATQYARDLYDAHIVER